MLTGRFKLILILCFMFAQMIGLKAMCQTGQQTSDETDYQKLAPLLTVVRDSGVSVWIEYHGSCMAESPHDIPLRLRFGPTEKNPKTDAVSKVRTILRENENLLISSTALGVINVNTTSVWSPLLNVRLNNLKLHGAELYNPSLAIAAAIRASQASWENLHTTPLSTFNSLLGELPTKGRPHLKQSAKYFTLNDLLIDVSQTFRGVLIYKECSLEDGTHVFDISFYRQ